LIFHFKSLPMPNNLLNAVQQNLGLSELKRVSTVTANVPNQKDSITQRLDQACLTAVFAGIFNLSRSEKGVDILINGNRDEYWPHFIFGEKAKEIVEKIVQYAQCNEAAVVATLDLVSADA